MCVFVFVFACVCVCVRVYVHVCNGEEGGREGGREGGEVHISRLAFNPLPIPTITLP